MTEIEIRACVESDLDAVVDLWRSPVLLSLGMTPRRTFDASYQLSRTCFLSGCSTPDSSVP